MTGRKEIRKGNIESAISLESMNNIFLSESVFGDGYVKELKEMDKHEIIVEIAEILGASSSALHDAEEIFKSIKYAIANYIIHHEYDSPNGVDADLLLWLDSRINPGNARKLNKFISKLFKS